MKIKNYTLDYVAIISRVEFPQALCVLFGLLLLLLWGGQWFGASSEIAAPVVSMAQQRFSETDIQKALTLPLFGKYVAKLSAGQVLQKSTIGLRLIGIMYSPTTENASQVVIRMRDGEEQTYGVGEQLPGGVTIEKIEANRVILRNDDVLEELTFPRLQLNFEKPAKPLIR